MRQILMCPYIKLTPWRRRWRRWRTPLRTSAAIPKSTYQPYGQRCRICAALLRCKRIPLSFHLHHTCVHADKRTSFETSIRRGYLHICNTSKIRSEIDDPFQCSTSTCSERSRIRSVFVSSPVQWNRLGDRIKIIQNWILTFDLIGRDRWFVGRLENYLWTESNFRLSECSEREQWAIDKKNMRLATAWGRECLLLNRIVNQSYLQKKVSLRKPCRSILFLELFVANCVILTPTNLFLKEYQTRRWN